jgi:hypothetical protein
MTLMSELDGFARAEFGGFRIGRSSNLHLSNQQQIICQANQAHYLAESDTCLENVKARPFRGQLAVKIGTIVKV